MPRVVSLHRYPVKSMLGEDVDSLEIDERGCMGDRLWSARTSAGKIGSGKSTRRFAAVIGLLDIRAERCDGRILLRFPDGARAFVDSEEAADRLSRHVGEPVTIAAETSASHFDDGPVSLIGTASVDAVAQARGQSVDVARFRANIVVDTDTAFLEEQWIGRELRIGTAVLRAALASPRCVMVDMATADLPAQPGNLTTIGRINDAALGIVATVVTAGTISVGDVVEVDPA